MHPRHCLLLILRQNTNARILTKYNVGSEWTCNKNFSATSTEKLSISAEPPTSFQNIGYPSLDTASVCSLNAFKHQSRLSPFLITKATNNQRLHLTNGSILKFYQEKTKSYYHSQHVRHFSFSSNHFAITPQTPETTQTSVDALQSIDAVSDAPARLLFPDFPTIHGAESAIMHIHNLTGLPWWLTIVTTAFLMRVILIFPLTMYSFQNAARLRRLEPEVKEIAERLKVEVSVAMSKFKWSPERAREEYIKNMKRLLKDLYIRDNCHPMKNTATFWIQIPVWLSVSYGLRNLSSRAISPALEHHEACQSLTEEGALWFHDMTLTDSTLLLPIAMGAVTLFNIEMTHLNLTEVTKYRKRLTMMLRCFALLFVPLSSTLPSAMVLYWVSSGTFAAFQNLLYDYSPFRRLSGLPLSETESKSPIKSLVKKAKTKYFKR